MIQQHDISISRSCRCAGLSRTAFYQQPIDWAIRDQPVINALNELTEEFPRLGFWKYRGILAQRGMSVVEFRKFAEQWFSKVGNRVPSCVASVL